MTKKWLALGATAILLTVVAACASSPSDGTRRSSDVITADEIASLTTVSTLYDVVSQLRPRWLTVRGGRSITGGIQTSIVVYQDQTYLGGPDVLRQFGPESVRSLQWLDGSRAAATLPGLGTRHVDGAIVLKTRDD
jgi:hypothetical protein